MSFQTSQPLMSPLKTSRKQLSLFNQPKSNLNLLMCSQLTQLILLMMNLLILKLNLPNLKIKGLRPDLVYQMNKHRNHLSKTLKYKKTKSSITISSPLMVVASEVSSLPWSSSTLKKNLIDMLWKRTISQLIREKDCQ